MVLHLKALYCRECLNDDITGDIKKMLENVGKMDRFELKSNLFKFSVEVPDNEETQTMQYLLTKVIAEELLKSDTENKLHYKKILDITNSQLSY